MSSASHEAYEGRVVFRCTYYSPLRYEQQRQLEEQLKAAPFADKFSVSDFAMLMTLTTEIEFNFKGDEGIILQDFRAWWDGHTKQEVPEQWQGYIALPGSVIMEWLAAVGKAFTPFTDPVTAPLELLTPEQREEATREDSPLAAHEKQPETAS